MNKLYKPVLFLILILLGGCNTDENCNEIACFTPPQQFIFNLIDKSTGNDVFIMGKYKQEDLKVWDVNLNKEIEGFEMAGVNENVFIQINSIGWETETVNYLLKIGDTEVCNLYVDAVRKYEDCCSFTSYNEISIENAEFEENTFDGYYTIYMQ